MANTVTPPGGAMVQIVVPDGPRRDRSAPCPHRSNAEQRVASAYAEPVRRSFGHRVVDFAAARRSGRRSSMLRENVDVPAAAPSSSN
jgi:hypothetical protein